MADSQKNNQDDKQAEAPAIFMPAQLIAGAEYFGTSPEIMAGALYGVTDSITREDAKKHLNAFLTKPVGVKKGV